VACLRPFEPEPFVQTLENLEMKKSLIALAAISATTAFAQSAVSITGIFDLGYQKVDAPANALLVQTGDVTRIAQNGSATTQINIVGVEDMGGGMKANFRFSINPDIAGGGGLTGGAGTTAGSGAVNYGNGGVHDVFLGLEGGFGDIRFGRVNTSTLSAWLAGSVFGTALGSGYGSNGMHTRYIPATANLNNTAPTRFNNSLFYSTPTFSGFRAAVNYVPQVDKAGLGGENACTAAACAADLAAAPGANRAGATDVGLFYSNGPLSVAYATQNIKVGANDVNALVEPSLNSTPSSSTKLNTLGANYTMGNVKVFFGYWNAKRSSATATSIDDKGQQIGVKYTMGNIDLSANMGKLSSSLTGTSANESDRKITGMGVDYNLSKRTAVYGRYESRNLDTQSTVTTAGAVSSTQGSTTKIMALGFRHSF